MNIVNLSSFIHFNEFRNSYLTTEGNRVFNANKATLQQNKVQKLT